MSAYGIRFYHHHYTVHYTRVINQSERYFVFEDFWHSSFFRTRLFTYNKIMYENENERYYQTIRKMTINNTTLVVKSTVLLG